ncbi:MAG: DUF3486 family protein [Gammaproteobacteria bacterium]|nr:DUF3486 family protein [Gammaproteobacteria bacterium]
MSENTRGRASKIDLLPPEIKSRLTAMLRDKQYSQGEILEEINTLIRECGLESELKISRSGLNRYATKMEKLAGRIRQAREVAEIWTKQLGEAPQGDIGKLLIEVVKQMAFETTMKLGENEDGIPPEVLNQLALIAQRIETAEGLSFKREQAIREETLKEAARAVEQAGKESGSKQEDVLAMVQAVYGISKRDE